MGMMIGDQNGIWEDLGGSISQPFFDTGELYVREYREKFSFQLVEAELIQIVFPDVFIVYGDMILKQHQIRMRSQDMPDMVELHFALQGSGTVLNLKDKKSFVFNPNQHSIMYVPEFDGIANYRPDEPYKFFELHFSTGYFLELIRDTTTLLQHFGDLVASKKNADTTEKHMPITLEMHQCIREILDCKFKGRLKMLFLQAKCIELLTLQAAAFEQRPEKSILKSSRDKDCILYAREYLLKNLANPPSLTELAAIAGTNTFKLKNGFKELFHQTVYGYLNEVKLQEAKERLRSGSSIKETAHHLGYSSVQHFSTAFRKQYGVTPGNIQFY